MKKLDKIIPENGGGRFRNVVLTHYLFFASHNSLNSTKKIIGIILIIIIILIIKSNHKLKISENFEKIFLRFLENSFGQKDFWFTLHLLHFVYTCLPFKIL